MDYPAPAPCRIQQYLGRHLSPLSPLSPLPAPGPVDPGQYYQGPLGTPGHLTRMPNAIFWDRLHLIGAGAPTVARVPGRWIQSKDTISSPGSQQVVEPMDRGSKLTSASPQFIRTYLAVSYPQSGRAVLGYVQHLTVSTSAGYNRFHHPTPVDPSHRYELVGDH